MSEFNNLMSSVNAAVARRNGAQLAAEMALPLSAAHPRPQDVQLAERARQVNVFTYCDSNIHDRNVSSFVGPRVAALKAWVAQDLDECYKQIHQAYNALLDYFSAKDEDSNWVIPVLVRVSNDLRTVAGVADAAKGDVNNQCLRECLNSLTKGFTAVAKDRTPVSDPSSKKLAIFAVTNVLFKVYFKLNTLQLCGKLINVVEGPGGIMDNLRLFPVCDVVMYKYYIGRLKMFEDKYEEARQCLRFALKHCPKTCLRNRQRILASLVPIEICLGVMPSEAVGRVYGLHELLTLGNAVRLGDLRTFEQVMSTCQRSFIRVGVYLVLEQAKIIAYRCLAKRIYTLTASTRLNLASFEQAMQWMGETADLDEIECILANLIFQGKIKGYLSHQKRYLIVSKADPFPSSAVIKKPSFH
jgi:nuclear mRNA export protein PCID2/THP1